MKSSLSDFGRLTILLCGLSAVARGELPLYQQEPFDQLTITVEDGNKLVLKVRALNFPDHKLPPKKPDEKLVVRLLDQPDKTFQLEREAVTGYKPFAEILLGEARTLAKEAKFDRAFEYFQFLFTRHPKFPGLDAAYEDYLYEEAKDAQRRGQYSYALAMLRELHARNPQRPELAKALPLTTDLLIDKYVAAGNYPAARRLLQSVAAGLPQDASVVKWQTRLQTHAGRFLAEATAACKAEKYRDAQEAVRRVGELWPQLSGAKDLAAELQAKYPQAVVGVTWPAGRPDPAACDDWGARRSGRLVHRMLSQCTGTAAGDYQIPVGTLTPDASRARLTLKLQPDLRWSAGTAVLTGHDVARQLLTLADPGSEAYRPGWDDWLAGVDVQGVYELQIALRRPHVRPEALLQTMLLPYTDPTLSGKSGISGGPYTLDARTSNEVCYTANPQFSGGSAQRPKEIVEHLYLDRETALGALRLGRVQVLDRVFPADLTAARGIKQVKVEPYALPSVHCLAPNLRRPLMAQRTFRRALLYALNRQELLNQLTGSQTLPGSQVLSGPFPAPAEKQGAYASAYDETLAPRAYDPRLAVVLFATALRSVRPQADPAKDLPALTLAYPDEPVARSACTAMVRQFALVGLTVRLKALPPPAATRLPDDADLLYAELIVQEPLVDARRILSAEGLAGHCSPQMREALRQLDQAADEAQARDRLRAIQRLAYQEVSVLPLWQIPEHYACHESLQGLSGTVLYLYQNAAQWQSRFNYPSE